MSETNFDADVLIIGAGMAGLTAARALAERGQHVVVLDARDHVGGRIMTRTVEGHQTVELGAEFLHGRAPELWSLLDEAGLTTTERDGAMLRESSPGELEDETGEDDDPFAALKQLEDITGSDAPFADWLAHSSLEDWQRAALTSYVEGFNAADARRIGIHALGAQQKAEDAIQGDRAWHLRGGYAQLPAYLASQAQQLGSDIRLNCEVLAVRWRPGHVELETNSCGFLVAPRCIVTLPLGVLHRVNDEGGVRFAPEPAAIAHARRLDMGHATRFTMVFREAWWLHSKACAPGALARMSFLFTQAGTPSVWWTTLPEPEHFPSITGWAGGPRAAALEGKSAAELGRSACTALARAFSVDEDSVRAALLSTHTHDWASDPLACGAYSYVPAGALDAPAAMAQPQSGTLFFAGEHTDMTAHWGTVHAALRSGLRAAEQVLHTL